MKRREFITLIGSATALWSIRAQTQQRAMRTIGWLSLGSKPVGQSVFEASFRSGLADLGYTEGKNIRVLYRYADLNANRLPDLTIELVSFGATAIVTAGSTAIVAAHNAAPNIPIVAFAGTNPVAIGWA